MRIARGSFFGDALEISAFPEGGERILRQTV
jgi:hypothetical protein